MQIDSDEKEFPLLNIFHRLKPLTIGNKTKPFDASLKTMFSALAKKIAKI